MLQQLPWPRGREGTNGVAPEAKKRGKLREKSRKVDGHNRRILTAIIFSSTNEDEKIIVRAEC
jgi:hypothetical protein